MLQRVERARALESREKYGAASQLSTPGARHQRNQATRWRSLQGAERHARSAVCAADAGYRNCSCGGAGRHAQSRAYKIAPPARIAHGCLTPRSSGAPTAGHASHQALGLRPILRLLPGASCRRRPLSSNVRLRRKTECATAAAIVAYAPVKKPAATDTARVLSAPSTSGELMQALSASAALTSFGVRGATSGSRLFGLKGDAPPVAFKACALSGFEGPTLGATAAPRAQLTLTPPPAACRSHKALRASQCRGPLLLLYATGLSVVQSLTPRSSRAPTACHAGPAGGTLYIVAIRARAPRRWCRLNSNVRLHTTPPCRL